MKRFALGVAYDGGAFEGWQTQPHGNTCQDTLERSLSHLAEMPIATVCAGRTDTGVHATAQVVHFETDADRPLSAWVRGTNARLPETLSVQWAVEVPEDFHARFSALSRSYTYRLLCCPVLHPLAQGRAWYHRYLDVASMRDSAVCLVGEHDFSAFRAAQCQARSPIRTMYDLSIKEEKVGVLQMVTFHFRANAFLHHMIRNLVGALVDVGSGKHSSDWLAHVLASKNRSEASRTFAPQGLCLTGVEYDAKFGIPDPIALL